MIILSFRVTLWNVLPILSQYWSSSSGRFRDTRPNRGVKKNHFLHLVEDHSFNRQKLLFHTQSEEEKQKKQLFLLRGSFMQKTYFWLKKKKVLKLAEFSVTKPASSRLEPRTADSIQKTHSQMNSLIPQPLRRKVLD